VINNTVSILRAETWMQHSSFILVLLRDCELWQVAELPASPVSHRPTGAATRFNSGDDSSEASDQSGVCSGVLYLLLQVVSNAIPGPEDWQPRNRSADKRAWSSGLRPAGLVWLNWQPQAASLNSRRLEIFFSENPFGSSLRN
jgi:hypothetical protein